MFAWDFHHLLVLHKQFMINSKKHNFNLNANLNANHITIYHIQDSHYTTRNMIRNTIRIKFILNDHQRRTRTHCGPLNLVPRSALNLKTRSLGTNRRTIDFIQILIEKILRFSVS